MLQRGGGPDLGDEPLGADGGGQLRLEDLDRDLPIVLQVLGEEHRGHPSFAQLAFDPVTIGEERGEPLGDVSHGARVSTRGLLDGWGDLQSGEGGPKTHLPPERQTVETSGRSARRRCAQAR